MKVKLKYAWYRSLKCSRASQINSCLSNMHTYLLYSTHAGWLRLQSWIWSLPSKTLSPGGFPTSNCWKLFTHHHVSLGWETNFKDGLQISQFLSWSWHVLKDLLSWVPHFPRCVGTFLLQRKANLSKILPYSPTHQPKSHTLWNWCTALGLQSWAHLPPPKLSPQPQEQGFWQPNSYWTSHSSAPR